MYDEGQTEMHGFEGLFADRDHVGSRPSCPPRTRPNHCMQCSIDSNLDRLTHAHTHTHTPTVHPSVCPSVRPSIHPCMHTMGCRIGDCAGEETGAREVHWERGEELPALELARPPPLIRMFIAGGFVGEKNSWVLELWQNLVSALLAKKPYTFPEFKGFLANKAPTIIVNS